MEFCVTVSVRTYQIRELYFTDEPEAAELETAQLMREMVLELPALVSPLVHYAPG